MTLLERIGEQLTKLVPSLEIYMENQTGGFRQPSFFIESIKTDSKSELFERQKRTHSYQVVYFPKLNKPKADLEAMQERLLDGFTVLDGFAYLRNRSFEEVDSTLTMTFDVVLWAHPVDDGTKLRKMDQTERVK